MDHVGSQLERSYGECLLHRLMIFEKAIRPEFTRYQPEEGTAIRKALPDGAHFLPAALRLSGQDANAVISLHQFGSECLRVAFHASRVGGRKPMTNQ